MKSIVELPATGVRGQTLNFPVNHSSNIGRGLRTIGQALVDPEELLRPRENTPESASPSTPRCRKLERGLPLFGRPLPQVHRDRELIHPTVRQRMREVIQGSSPWPLVLTGAAGTGKTCGALCLIDHFGGWFLSLPGFLSMLIRAANGQLQYSSGYARTVGELWRDWTRANLAVLDELGARGIVSDFHYETLLRAIDDRHARPTILISNYQIEELAKVYDDRIASRLAAGTVIAISGTDRRLRATHAIGATA